MKLSNIRENFSEKDDDGKREFFRRYHFKRADDFAKADVKVVKPKKSSSSSSSSPSSPKEKPMKLTAQQLELLKLLNLA